MNTTTTSGIFIQNGWKDETTHGADMGVYFADGQRKIDMVLAFEDEDEDGLSPTSSPTVASSSRRSSRILSAARFAANDHRESVEMRRDSRKTFERNLQLAGLQLEHEHRSV